VRVVKRGPPIARKATSPPQSSKLSPLWVNGLDRETKGKPGRGKHDAEVEPRLYWWGGTALGRGEIIKGCRFGGNYLLTSFLSRKSGLRKGKGGAK